ncbi:hypothetical protein [Psychrobacillus psychrotolerans]|uniref:hypothetical protein n=2 Tax=Psychrobacillus psychrotolerans TaxID=126156 RepID=UPI00331513B3
MMKTVKGKVIAGTVAVTLFAGVGAAFGASDAGLNLKNWYKTQFTSSSGEVNKQVADYAGSKVDGLTKEYNTIKTDAGASINEKGGFVTEVASGNIDDRSREHIDSIKEEKAHIETYLAGQFDSLSTYTQGLINEAGKEALKYANNDLAQYTDKAGKAAVEKVNTDVKAATALAVKDLKDTIYWAKSDLQTKLDKERDLTVVEIKGMIDAKIVELRGEITKKTTALVKEQEKIITMTAKGLQIAGLKELDDLVSGMNN